MPNNLRTAHHLTCVSAAGGLLYLAYLYVTTTTEGLHPAIAGLLIGCLIVLSMCYPEDPFTLDDESSESTQNQPEGPTT